MILINLLFTILFINCLLKLPSPFKLDDMDELKEKIGELEKKIDSIRHTVEAIKKIFFWTAVVSLAIFILPLLGLLIVLPQFLSTYGGLLQ
jgi:hypothetical protein